MHEYGRVGRHSFHDVHSDCVRLVSTKPIGIGFWYSHRGPACCVDHIHTCWQHVHVMMLYEFGIVLACESLGLREKRLRQSLARRSYQGKSSVWDFAQCQGERGSRIVAFSKIEHMQSADLSEILFHQTEVGDRLRRMFVRAHGVDYRHVWL